MYSTYVNISYLSDEKFCVTWPKTGRTRAVLVFATERKNNVDPCLRSQTNVD